MNTDSKTARLQQMMKSYEGPKHSVVGLSLQNSAAQFVGTGPNEVEVPWGEMIFEIGSITKVFTAILLCVIVEEGKIDPLAPLREMSEDLSDVPSWITPQSLTSHTSGLPRIHVPIWKALIKPLPEDPYANFTRSDLLAWLGKWFSKRPTRKQYHAYSNLAIGLLGEALAMKEGKPFTELLEEKVIRPLGLKDTAARLNKNQSARFAQPRNTKGDAVVPWTFKAMAAAGCLRSTANDLARFSTLVLQALEEPETTLDRAIQRSATPLIGLGRKGRLEPSAQCSGWLSTKMNKEAPRILHHDGATAGSTCAIYICPGKAQALAVLSSNGVVANLSAGSKLSWSNQTRQAHDYFTAP